MHPFVCYLSTFSSWYAVLNYYYILHTFVFNLTLLFIFLFTYLIYLFIFCQEYSYAKLKSVTPNKTLKTQFFALLETLYIGIRIKRKKMFMTSTSRPCRWRSKLLIMLRVSIRCVWGRLTVSGGRRWHSCVCEDRWKTEEERERWYESDSWKYRDEEGLLKKLSWVWWI